MAFDYTRYSFDELVAEVSRLLATKDEWKDAYQSSTGQVLIQMVAAITDQLHYMLERRSQENFLPTARLQTSVNAIVNLLGYKPRRKISASGTLSLNLVDGEGINIQNTDSIIIPKYSHLTYDNKLFCNTESILLLPTQTYPFTFDVKEGTVETTVYDPSDNTSTLYLNNYIDIPDYLNIEDTSFYIYTSTQTFSDVTIRDGDKAPIDSIGFATSTDKVYDINLTNSGLRIVFGDGKNGEKPVGELTVKYILSSGVNIEVNTTGNEFTFNDFITDLVDESATAYKYTLSNSTTITGGRDEETVDDIKTNAPSYVRTANRAVTKYDYEYWVKDSNIGNVIDAKVYGEEELGITTVNANNVYVVYLTKSGVPLSSIDLSALDKFMDNYRMLTTSIIYTSSTIIPLQIKIKIKRSTGLTASNSEVYDVVTNELISYFTNVEGSIGKSINHSELVDKFHGLTIVKSGISRVIADYVNVDIKALYYFDVPWVANDNIDVTFSYGSDSDTYTILINGIEYTYVAQGGDTVTDVVDKLFQYISLDANVVVSRDTNVLNLVVDNSAISNLLKFSEELSDSSWSTTGTISVTDNNALAPNGLTSATTLNDTDAVVTSYITQTGSISIDVNTKTISLFIKKDSDTSRYPAISILFTGGTPVQSLVSFNTSAGTTAVISGATPTIVVESFIDYWRLSISLPNNNTNTILGLEIFPAYSATLGGTASVSTTGSIDVYGIQIEEKATAGKYLRTRTAPRTLVYDESIIENRLLYSESLDNSVWTKTGTTITPDSTNDSDGFATIDTVTFAGAAAAETVQQTISPIHHATYTLSWRAKQGTLSSAAYGVYDVTNSVWIIDPVVNIKTLTASLDLYTVSFLVPETCNSIRIHPVYLDDTAGTLFLGQVHLHKTSNSLNYISSFDKVSVHYNDNFTITNNGTTTVANALINTPIQLPLPLLNNSENAQLFYPTSIELINDSGTVISTDDGAGNIYGGTIDYITGLITIAILPDLHYYIRYQHNVDQNYRVNEKQSFTYALPKSDYTGTTELLSTIEIAS